MAMAEVLRHWVAAVAAVGVAIRAAAARAAIAPAATNFGIFFGGN
jgi:hypothetical protein